MRYIDDYRDGLLMKELVGEIRKISVSPVVLMEVCGSHTMAIHKFGIQSLLPPAIRLVSGPGCPVCVSSMGFVDKAIALSRMDHAITVTYGDLIRVPGSESSLEKERSNGSDIRIIYSLLEALVIAKNNPEHPVIFPAIGFETTAPATAAVVKKAAKEEIHNFFVLSAHKIMSPVLKALVDGPLKIDGFLAPGHVSAITGSSIYQELADKYGRCVVISGFEPVDIFQSIRMLINQVNSRQPRVEIEYSRVVKPEGNPAARRIMNEVFEPADEIWRGFGNIPLSGLKFRKEYDRFDAEKIFPVKVPEFHEPAGCRCGEVLRGMIDPTACSLFAVSCTPDNPIGACMISSEGTCAAYYKYRKLT
ncbi:MAG: hydrogenase formation protein HypD [Bacteroidota bacterium]|nr:hydrogenase formation protein HypD [Bacteroidota bacterium]